MKSWDAIRMWGSIAVAFGAFGSAGVLLLSKNISRRKGWVCATLICAYIGMVLGDMAMTPKVEWTPHDVTSEEVLGTWSDGRETVVLKEDGTFSYRGPTGSEEGKWTRGGWTLKLGGKTMWFVRHKGHCRLMTNPPDSPEYWDRRTIGLARIEPARRAAAK